MDNIIPTSKEIAEEILKNNKDKVFNKIGYIPSTNLKILINEVEIEEYNNISLNKKGYIVICHGYEINTKEYVNGEISNILNIYKFD